MLHSWDVLVSLEECRTKVLLAYDVTKVLSNPKSRVRQGIFSLSKSWVSVSRDFDSFLKDESELEQDAN
jgi:hypothetical protein